MKSLILLVLAADPELKIIPAAKTSELTPAIRVTRNGADWARSHGDATSSRYSALKQINRENVKRLTVAWTYRSGDGKANIQANPVIVGGVLYAPTAGEQVVAIDAATGREKWRFAPEGKPAFRGLTYWRGDGTAGAAALLYGGGLVLRGGPDDGPAGAGFRQKWPRGGTRDGGSGDLQKRRGAAVLERGARL